MGNSRADDAIGSLETSLHVVNNLEALETETFGNPTKETVKARKAVNNALVELRNRIARRKAQGLLGSSKRHVYAPMPVKEEQDEGAPAAEAVTG